MAVVLLRRRDRARRRVDPVLSSCSATAPRTSGSRAIDDPVTAVDESKSRSRRCRQYGGHGLTRGLAELALAPAGALEGDAVARREDQPRDLVALLLLREARPLRDLVVGRVLPRGNYRLSGKAANSTRSRSTSAASPACSSPAGSPTSSSAAAAPAIALIMMIGMTLSTALLVAARRAERDGVHRPARRGRLLALRPRRAALRRRRDGHRQPPRRDVRHRRDRRVRQPRPDRPGGDRAARLRREDRRTWAPVFAMLFISAAGRSCVLLSPWSIAIAGEAEASSDTVVERCAKRRSSSSTRTARPSGPCSASSASPAIASTSPMTLEQGMRLHPARRAAARRRRR